MGPPIHVFLVNDDAGTREEMAELLRSTFPNATVVVAASLAELGSGSGPQAMREAQALAESEERYRTLVEHAPESIVVFDPDEGRFVDLNPNAERLFRMDRSALLRSNPFELSPARQPDGRSSLESARGYITEALAGETPVFEWVHRDAEGGDHPCEIRLVRLPSSARRLIRGSITDISERRRLEEQLRQAQKMEAIGRLAGGVAHDFNNLLTAIIGYADLAQAQRTVEEMSRHLDGIQRSAERAAGLTRQLLALGRKQVVRPQVLDLNDVVRSMGQLLRRVIGEDVALVTVLHPEPLHVEVDRVQIEQVMLNLCVNARDAMPEGGRLTLETGSGGPSTPWRTHGDDTHARLSVRDTGHGMDEATRARVFEPFFTTKEPGRGTGLGLATVYGIVEQSGGTVEVDSQPGNGSAFHVHLPRSRRPAATEETPAEGPYSGSETVLLVEDEKAVRLPCAESLRRAGYWVIEAADGEQALELAREHGSSIHLLVTDVIMPGLSGTALAERVLVEHPEARVLFMSGYTDEHLRRTQSDGGRVEFLQKPFSPSTLGRRVRSILDRPRVAQG